MNFNLKNTPKDVISESWDKWKEGFEKELKEWQRRIKHFPDSPDYDAGQNSVIRQVLGE